MSEKPGFRELVLALALFIPSAAVGLSGCGGAEVDDGLGETVVAQDLSQRPMESGAPVPTGTPIPTPKVTPTYAPVPTTTPVPDSPELTGTAALDAEEGRFLELINAHRAANGVGPLKVSLALTRASDWLSVDMATYNYFSHTDRYGRASGARMTAFGYDYSGYRGENIAAGNGTAQRTFEQWKNSSGHNANMLNARYAVIGIGRASGSSSGYSWYWTTDFGSVVDETLK